MTWKSLVQRTKSGNSRFMGQEVLLIAVGQGDYCFVTRGGSCSRGNRGICFLNGDFVCVVFLRELILWYILLLFLIGLCCG